MSLQWVASVFFPQCGHCNEDFPTDDLFGIVVSIMAMSIFLFINFQEVLRHSFVRYPIVVWLIAYVLEMFKMAPIKVRNVEPGLPN